MAIMATVLQVFQSFVMVNEWFVFIFRRLSGNNLEAIEQNDFYVLLSELTEL